MAAEDLAAAHYQAQAELGRQAAIAGQELWQRIDPKAVLPTWRPLVAKAAAVLAAAQYAAAARAQPYVANLAQSMGVQPSPAAALDPAAFAGRAANGGDLASMLLMPAVQTVALLAGGADDRTALRAGLAALTRMMATETADAGRVATSVAMTADRQFVTYVRVVHSPACARCIILAGREYTWSTGFQRHPRCDCTMVPRVHRPGRGYDTPAPASPDELVARMSPEEQDRIFGKAGAKAIREGADIGQVVNARRGMTTAGGKSITTEGTTSRGHAGRLLGQLSKQAGDRYRRSQIPRLTPEQIYREAGDDRDEAIRLLQRFGYLDKGSTARRARAVAKVDQAAAAEREALRAEQARQADVERARRAIDEVRRKAEEARQAAEQAALRQAEERARREAAEQARRDAVPVGARPYHRSLDGLEDLARRVETQKVTETRRLGGASAQTELVTFADGSKAIRKAARVGLAESQDAAAEHAAQLIARKLGLKAPRVYRNDAGTIWMEYVQDGVTAEEGGLLQRLRDRFTRVPGSDRGKVLGLLDLLTNNVDRNAGNWMLDKAGDLIPIDHGMAYGEFIEQGMEPTLEWVHSDFAAHYKDPDTDKPKANPLTKADVAEVRRRLEELRPDFEHIGRGHWLDYSLRMLDLLGRYAKGSRDLIAGVR
ncbi:hypothetical protein FLW53_23430 [Microbispora sp. SCL1-1]|uniref:VG15 protein n=1 Tax=unclassified Microbispora TaxID=2614687 RepID=UPI0011586102|nr:MULTISPECIES: hypothetical protein [unclassified Microbispora]NJP27097.1 hypothetical protein [Microbispora sp. CL1-1]TQS11442.1 hypothetical protein FLW53_23430 [Microbispora sp. SCL1-1]